MVAFSPKSLQSFVSRIGDGAIKETVLVLCYKRLPEVSSPSIVIVLFGELQVDESELRFVGRQRVKRISRLGMAAVERGTGRDEAIESVPVLVLVLMEL